MIARLIKRFVSRLAEPKVRVVGITADRRTKAQRLSDQMYAILRSDARAEIEFRERVRENLARRLDAKHKRISILTKQAG